MPGIGTITAVWEFTTLTENGIPEGWNTLTLAYVTASTTAAVSSIKSPKRRCMAIPCQRVVDVRAKRTPKPGHGVGVAPAITRCTRDDKSGEWGIPASSCPRRACPAKAGAGIQRGAGTTLLDPRLALRAPGDDEDGAAFATL